jgi:hypothetical protein
MMMDVFYRVQKAGAMQRQRTEAQNGVFLQQALSIVIDKKRVKAGWHFNKTSRG